MSRKHIVFICFSPQIAENDPRHGSFLFFLVPKVTWKSPKLYENIRNCYTSLYFYEEHLKIVKLSEFYLIKTFSWVFMNILFYSYSEFRSVIQIHSNFIVENSQASWNNKIIHKNGYPFSVIHFLKIIQ